MRTIREAAAERRLIKEIERLGCKAYHLDTGVDGWPDMTVVGKRIVFIEMKAHKESELLSSVMEPTQPVRIRELVLAGYDYIYVCNFDGEKYILHTVLGILEKTLAGERLESLPMAIMADAPTMASVICEVCNGDR